MKDFNSIKGLINKDALQKSIAANVSHLVAMRGFEADNYQLN